MPPLNPILQSYLWFFPFVLICSINSSHLFFFFLRGKAVRVALQEFLGIFAVIAYAVFVELAVRLSHIHNTSWADLVEFFPHWVPSVLPQVIQQVTWRHRTSQTHRLAGYYVHSLRLYSKSFDPCTETDQSPECKIKWVMTINHFIKNP